ncbi:MAG: DUF262 domain-containing protein [Dehalococcoidia bacterium]
MLQQYPISDLYRWIKEKTLILNPEFQRRNNWPASAKRYLIDTLLRGLPMPRLYIRTVTDPKSKISYREVVDGQQRLRTITEFIDGEFTLGRDAREFAGKKYQDLEEDEQRRFLSYEVSVEQLFDASDDLVLDIFHRLNAYGLSVNPQELRHGKFQGGKYRGVFRWAVIEASKRWVILWKQYKVVSVRARVRMADDELMAQMLGIVLEGVKDGGQPAITRLYEKYDQELPPGTEQIVDQVVRSFSEILTTRLSGAPHFLMLFAAVAHALVGIPEGDMGGPNPPLPDRDPRALTNLAVARGNLGILADVLEFAEEDVPPRFITFKLASAGTTQRIRSRSRRFDTLYQALLPDEI